MSDTRMHPLKQARKRLGFSQAALADFALISKSTIERAEAGKPIRANNIQQICSYFSERYNRQVEPKELGLVHGEEENYESDNVTYASEEQVSEEDKESSDTVNRREATKRLGAILGTALLTPQELLKPQPWAQFSKVLQERPSIDENTLGLFGNLTETCFHLSKGNELAVAEQTLRAYLPRVEALAKRPPSEKQRTAAAIASQGYQLESMLAGHQLNLPAREAYGQLAVLYGLESGDRNVYVAALTKLGTTFYYNKQFTNALQAYQEAFQYIDEISPLLRSRLYIQAATVLTHFEREEDAKRYINLAYEHFPVYLNDDPSSLYADYGRSSLSLWGGLTWLSLDRPKEAWETFAQVGELQPTLIASERNRIEIINHQAETAIALGDQELFKTYLKEGLMGAKRLGSEKRRREAWDTYEQAKRTWRNDRGILLLRKDLLDIDTTLLLA